MDTLKKKIFASADKSKEVLKKYTKLWDRIKNLIECNSIEKINGKSVDYEKDFMKIKFNSDDNLSLNKILKHHNLTVVVRSIFQEDNKYYPQFFLDECLYELLMLEFDIIDISEEIDKK